MAKHKHVNSFFFFFDKLKLIFKLTSTIIFHKQNELIHREFKF